MPVVAQINVNFANLQEVRNTDEFDIAAGGDFQIEDKAINPNILSKYSLYNREFGDTGDYGLSDVEYLRYIGGFVTAGDKINVKHSNLHVRNNMYVGDNLYTEYIYSRFYGKTDAEYQDERSKNPRFITLSPKFEDRLSTYVTIQTTDANTRFIDLHAQRSTVPNKIRIDSNQTTDKIDILSPLINLKKEGGSDGTVNIDSFLNVSNDTRIGTTKFVVTASTGKTQIAGDLNIGSVTTGAAPYNRFTVASSTGNTVIEGTLSVTGNTTLKSNVTFEGGTNETFVINNGTSGQDRFTVQSTTGNTEIQGTLNVTGTTTLKNTVTIEGGTGESFIINTGPAGTNKFTVESSSGNTDIQGTLDVKGNTKINSDKFIVTASDGKTQIAGDLNIGSTTTGAEAYGNFIVASSTGNTDINGTVNINNIVTLDSTADENRRVTGLSNKTAAVFVGATRDFDAINISDIKSFTTPDNNTGSGTSLYVGRNTTTARPMFRKIVAGNNISVTVNTEDNVVITNTAPLGLYLNLTGYSTTDIPTIIAKIFPPANFSNGTQVRVWTNSIKATTTGTTVAAGSTSLVSSANSNWATPVLTVRNGIGAIGATKITSWSAGSFGDVKFTGKSSNLSATTNLSVADTSPDHRLYVKTGSNWVFSSNI